MKQKTLVAIILATIMVLIAFSSAIGIQSNTHKNSSTSVASVNIASGSVLNNPNNPGLTVQEKRAFREYKVYTFVNYGINSNKLDQLYYAADLNFATWYASNCSEIPAMYRGISQVNASVMLPMWENSSQQAQSDLQAIEDYQMSQSSGLNEMNLSYVENNHLGTIVSNVSMIYNNETANMVTYKYSQGNESLIYSLMEQNGIAKPVDPTVRVNAFTIHWGWFGAISGTSYNIYFVFTNYNNALNFKNFLTSALTIKSSVDFSSSLLGWVILGTGIGSVVPGVGNVAGAIVGLATGIVAAIESNTDPVYVGQQINGLFTNQEAYNGQFSVAYTYNAWSWGLVPEYSWWGYMNPGQVLTQIYKDVTLPSAAEGAYLFIYNTLANSIGTNVEKTFPAPANWYSIGDVIASWTAATS